MNKKVISLLVAGVMVFSTAGCGAASDSSSTDGDGGTSVYTGSIFDTSYIHEIDVQIAEEDWADLLENPTEKTKYATDVTIDGTSVSNVSFATKGNTSLSQVASSDSDRYSFKINFGKYVEGQTYDGLDKLNLNNTYSDATYLKDYLSYRIMAEAGASAPLVSFVSLSINGEVYGLYVAVEEVGDSFLERVYGEDAGELYKPETSQIGGMGGGAGRGGDENNTPPDMGTGTGFGDGDMTMPQGDQAEDSDDGSGDGNRTPPDMGTGTGFGDGEMPMFQGDQAEASEDGGGGMPQGGRGGAPGAGGDMGGMGGTSNGADLVYTDDEISSYSDIFDNAETSVDDEDKQRVIAALKALSEGGDLSSSIDVEAVMRYFVAHNFVINFDSYTGNMLHNYYLYEEDGVLSMLPWDYNLAFGGFSGGSDASEAVNWPIDSPLSGASDEERPMWSQLSANEEYLSLYHTYFDELLTNYFESGRFEEEIDTVYELIRPYVEEDPTAFYTVDEFDTAFETLRSFCLLRAESIRGQLDGTIPSTSAGQQEDSSALIDADGLSISDMGGMGGMGGGGRGGVGGGPRDFTGVPGEGEGINPS